MQQRLEICNPEHISQVRKFEEQHGYFRDLELQSGEKKKFKVKLTALVAYTVIGERLAEVAVLAKGIDHAEKIAISKAKSDRAMFDLTCEDELVDVEISDVEEEGE